MADLNYVSPLTSDLTDYYTKSEVDELQQGDAATYATSAEIVAGDNAVKGWVVSQGFLTEHQDLTNYATISYVDDAIAAIEPSSGGMAVRVVNTLPAVGEENVLYLVFVDNEDEDNRYAEYIWSDTLNGYEMLGYGTGEGVMPDLTNYATKSYVDTAVGAIVVPDVSDFIDAEKAASIAADEVEYKMNTLSTVAVSGSYDDLTDKPTIPAAPDLSSYATKSELSAKANAADLATVATSGDYDDLSNKPAIPSLTGYATEAYVNSAVEAIDIPDVSNFVTEQDIAGLESQLENKQDASTLATVATTGSYNDLANKPAIPTVPTNVSAFTNDAGYLTAHQDISGKANTADLATVATSGDYNDLINKPTIPAAPDLTPYATKQELTAKADAASLASVATSGDYDDLTNKPTIPSAGIPSAGNMLPFGLLNNLNGTPFYCATKVKSDVIKYLASGYWVRYYTSKLTLHYYDFPNIGTYSVLNLFTFDSASNQFILSSVSDLTMELNYVYAYYGSNVIIKVNFNDLNKVYKALLYDNTTSGLTATTIQGAIDELAASSGGASTAAQLSYDNTNTWNDGTDTDTVQEAIDSLYADVDGVSQRVDGVERSIADLPAGYEISETYDDRNKSLTLSVVESSGR